ncbi:MAG: hypothetical protein KW802_03510 [Candidatus Doudnabacteria bacterium]|nr:hypothetical protein [Candidatus Doudnabacteria bacterium]
MRLFKGPINLSVLILVLIILVILAALFFAYVNAQAIAHDRRRLQDVEQIQAALKIYYDENGFYPASSNGMPKDIETYLSFWPVPPKPEGNCTKEDNQYAYTLRPGNDYWLTFCLAGSVGNLPAGEHQASSKGIQ